MSSSSAPNIDVPKMRTILCFTFACCTVSCNPPISHSPIIDGYNQQRTFLVGESQSARPSHSRVGNHLTLSDGLKVIVVGYQMPGGPITARYTFRSRPLRSIMRAITSIRAMCVSTSNISCALKHQRWRVESPMKLGYLARPAWSASDRTPALQTVALPIECPESSLINRSADN